VNPIFEQLIQRYDIDLAESPQVQAVLDYIDELILALKCAAISNNNSDHWNPYSPFAFKISELTGTTVPYEGVKEGETL